MLLAPDSSSDTTEGAPSSTQQDAWARPLEFDALNQHGWHWRPEETVDANYLDLAYLIARNSTCKDGHMGCVIVAGVERDGGDAVGETAREIVTCTINSSLFGAHRSDCHAEANAVASCAANGAALRGRSCYVTRAPCVACYKLLAAAGIRRVVAPQPMASADCNASAAALGIECRAVVDTNARSAWREALARSHQDMHRVRELRAERKRLRKENTYGRKTISSSTGASLPAEG